MAMTATIATNPATTAVTEQLVTCVLTISNSAAYPIDMTAVVPYVLSTGGVKSVINTGVSIGAINFGPGAAKTVPASGTLVITFPVTFHAPSSGILANVTETYDVGATCYSNDASVFIPTAATITINYAVSYPASQQ